MTMTRTTGTLAATILACSALLPAQTTTPKRGALVQDCLPASTWAMAGFAGLESCSAAVAEHAAANLVQRLLALLPAGLREARLTSKLDEAAEGLREGLAQGAFSPAAVRAVLQRPIAVGIGRLTIQGMGPSFAIVIDEGDAAAEIDRLVDQVVAARVLPARLGQGEAAGIACRTLEGEEMPTLFLVREGGRFVLTNSEGYLVEILRTTRGEQPSLAVGTSLGAQRRRLGADPLLEVYGNAKPMLGIYAPLLPYEAPAIGKALGVESVDGLYVAAAPMGDGTVETFDLAMPGDRDGLLKAALSGATDYEAARWFGEDTLAFASVRLDLPKAIAAFDAALDQLPPSAVREVRRDLSRDLARAFGRAGISAAELEELLAALHGSIAVGVTLEPGAIPVPSMLAVAKVRDAAVVGRWLARLREASGQKGGFDWKVRQRGDVTLHYASIEAAAKSMVPLVPCFALTDGHLVIGTQVLSVMDALGRREAEGDGLHTAADFVEAMRSEAGAMAFLHLRPGHAVETHWRTIEAWGLPQIDAHSDELGFGSEDLPEAETFARGLGSITWSVTVDGDGMRLRTRGSLGLGAAIAGFFATFDDVLMRAGKKAY